ncbi:MAG TPA: hypothetical protein VM100_08805 [Longimicrobiales bacterium]|nr:hypothetical protein [Longimicrobiales bacterium]
MGFRNKKKGLGIGLADIRTSPRRSEEQDQTEPERQMRPDEDANVGVNQPKDPREAEGDR